MAGDGLCTILICTYHPHLHHCHYHHPIELQEGDTPGEARLREMGKCEEGEAEDGRGDRGGEERGRGVEWEEELACQDGGEWRRGKSKGDREV